MFNKAHVSFLVPLFCVVPEKATEIPIGETTAVSPGTTSTFIQANEIFSTVHARFFCSM